MRRRQPKRVWIMFVMFLMGLSELTQAAEHGSVVLSVLTFNVHGLPPALVPNHGRFKKIGEILNKRRAEGSAPHVVVLQEAFSDDSKEVIGGAGYPYVVEGPKGKGFWMSSGLYIMSEFPIVDANKLVYRACASWDCFARKGVVHARLEVPDAPFPVDVFNTHLNSDPDMDFWTSPERTQKARFKQINEMAVFVTQHKTPDSVVLMPGDYNFGYNQTEFLLFGFLSNATSSGRYCSESRACSGIDNYAAELKWSVDHEFFNTGSDKILVEPVHFERNFKEPVEGRYLSDHTGLEVHYRLTW